MKLKPLKGFTYTVLRLSHTHVEWPQEVSLSVMVTKDKHVYL